MTHRTTIFSSSLQGLAVAGALGLFGTAIAHAAPVEIEQAARADVEGSATNVSGECPNLEFQIGETRVVTNDQTIFEDGSCRDLENGDRLEVEGNLSAEGKLTAVEVDFDG